MMDSFLQQKVHLLKSTSLFRGTSELDANVHKYILFLVLAGAKPLGFVSSGHWKKTPTGRVSHADDPQAVQELLDQLELKYRITTDPIALDAHVALHEDILEQYKHTDDHRTVGLLYGYPQTAVDAFMAKQSMTPEEQEALLHTAGIHPTMPTFRLSLTHAHEELKVLQRWQTLLKEYGLL